MVLLQKILPGHPELNIPQSRLSKPGTGHNLSLQITEQNRLSVINLLIYSVHWPCTAFVFVPIFHLMITCKSSLRLLALFFWWFLKGNTNFTEKIIFVRHCTGLFLPLLLSYISNTCPLSVDAQMSRKPRSSIPLFYYPKKIIISMASKTAPSSNNVWTQKGCQFRPSYFRLQLLGCAVRRPELEPYKERQRLIVSLRNGLAQQGQIWIISVFTQFSHYLIVMTIKLYHPQAPRKFSTHQWLSATISKKTKCLQAVDIYYKTRKQEIGRTHFVRNKNALLLNDQLHLLSRN